MEEMLSQIKGAISCNLYYSALFMTVAIPDICSALQSKDNKATGAKYRNWFDKYLPPIAPSKYGIDGQLKAIDLWHIRCSLLHQGQTNSQGGFQRLLFIEPGTAAYKGLNSIHCCIVGFGSSDQSLLIDIVRFCNDMIKGVEDWQKEMEGNTYYENNSSKLIKRYPTGIEPLLDLPLIG